MISLRVSAWTIGTWSKAADTYRAFKRLGGKLQGVYIGRDFDLETARAKNQGGHGQV